MLSGGVVVVTVVSLISLATTGHVNPYFACTTNSYIILPNESDEIMLHNCSASTADDIIDHLRQSRLRGRPIRLNAIVSNLTSRAFFTSVVDFDLSNMGLSELDLRNAQRLERVNLTSNKFHSLSSIRLRENTTLTRMDVSYNRLSVLRSSDIPSTAHLSLRSNAIMEVEANLTLPNALLELDLTRNEIENISLVSFSSPYLTTLNLSINLINAISMKTFLRLPALQVLQLECNKIVEIEPDTFDGNSGLIELNLRDNNIFTLRKGVFNRLLNLKVLDVSKNRLLRLTPDNVRELNNLVHFSMSENTKLCRDQCKRDSPFLLTLGGRLRTLKASGIGMRTFPVVLTTSVRTLDLSANKFTRVQTGSLENFPLLRALDLSGNTIHEAEKDVFSRMEYLEELYLQDNRLNRVPSSLPSSLSVLRLDGNRIRTISAADFDNLHRLKDLRLNSNLIAIIEGDTFSRLSDLRFLEISRNPIQQLRMDLFAGAITLRTLYATDLILARVNATNPRHFPTSDLPSLRYLNLSQSAELAHCFLRDYPLLATMKQLEVLDLDKTHLTHVPYHLQNFLPRLRLLSLRGNPLDCSDRDNLSGAWKELHRLETPRHITSDTDLTVRVTPSRAGPSCGRITIRSKCTLTANCSISSKQDIWSHNIPPRAPTQNERERKLNIGSLTQRAIVDTTDGDDSTTTTIWLRAWQQTIRERTTPMTARSSTEFTAAAPVYIHSTSGSASDAPSSFLDWFAPLNYTAAGRASVADAEIGHDEDHPNTHPGLFVFLFMCTLVLLAVFASMIVPACAQTRVNRWTCEYRASHSVQSDSTYMEISSISTSIHSEIHLNAGAIAGRDRM